jgi:formylglycine-generating enzyme required for sulfatase activity
VDLFPPTAGEATPKILPVAIPVTPRRGVVARAVAATARAIVGCLALFLLVIASTIAGLILLRSDHGPPPSTGPAGGPPPPGMVLVGFTHGGLEPSYAPRAVARVPHRFEIATTEVTREQFRAFARGAPYRTVAERGDDGGRRGALLRTADGKGGGWSNEATWDAWRPDLPGNTPVVCVAWEDALRFCNWLSDRDGRPRCYELRGAGGGWTCDFEADGYRLPTEAEWEYAARAEAPTLYPEPEPVLRQHGWFREDAGSGPHPVGQKSKNPRELCDVWGNVWEWCWDRHDPAPQGPLLEPYGPKAGGERVVRGGSWCEPVPASPAATRKGQPPDYRANDLGFRVVRTLR